MKMPAKKLSRRSFLFVLFFCLLLVLFNTKGISAQEEAEIYSVKIQANLQDDGSADITEVWDVNVDPSTDWTEWYLPKDHLNGSKISNFSVHDEENNVFASSGDHWDLNGSLEDKAQKCGINYDSDADLELCWGLGSYGHHQYSISYHVTELVDAYPDKDGFNWRFINDKLNAIPQQVEVRIRAPFDISEENARIWLYGNTGEIHFTESDQDQQGIIVAKADGANYNSSSNHVTIVAGFDKGLFHPSRERNNESFAELSDRAKVGSDFEEKKQGLSKNVSDDTLDILVISLLVFLYFFFFIIYYMKTKDKDGYGNRIKQFRFKKRQIANLPYEREPAFEGDLCQNYSGLCLIHSLESPSDLISSFLLSWMYKDHVRFEKTERKVFFGLIPKKENSIIFLDEENPFSGKDAVQEAFWNYLVKASGGDQILQEYELEHCINKDYKKFLRLLEYAYEVGLQGLVSQGLYKKEIKKGIFSEKKFYEPAPDARNRLSKILSFKKYLKDYTLLSERSADEVVLWDSYLIFACLYGIADEVAEEFKKLNPRYFEQFERNHGGSDFMASYTVMRSISTSSYGTAYSHTPAAAAAAASGRGGSGSSGGGGGSSGGGSGGGGR